MTNPAMKRISRLASVAAIGLLLAACDKCGDPVKFFTPPDPFNKRQALPPEPKSCSVEAPRG